MCLPTHEPSTRRSNANSSCFQHDAPNRCRIGQTESTSPLLSQKQEGGTYHFYHWLFSRRHPWTTLFISCFAFWPLQQFPDLDVKGYGIMDDVTILGIASHLGPIYARMQLILKDCLHLDINLTKSSLIALQLYTIVSPDCDLTPLYQECPDLRSLPVKTELFVCWGTHGLSQFSEYVYATHDWGIIHGVSETYFIPPPA